MFTPSNTDQARTLLQGGYDLHIHPIPSHVPRLLDDFKCSPRHRRPEWPVFCSKTIMNPLGPGLFLPTAAGEIFTPRHTGPLLSIGLGGIKSLCSS